MVFSEAGVSRGQLPYIDVILKDGTYHHFTPRVLDVLLDTSRVKSFKRRTGWTTVGVDPVRKSRRENGDLYSGPERRRLM